jgi:hypothetical protein
MAIAYPTPRVQPVGLAPFRLDVWKYGSEANATVAGWGTMSESGIQSQLLRAVSVPIIDFKRCNDAYFFIKDGHICAGDIDHGGKLTEHFFLIHATSKN